MIEGSRYWTYDFNDGVLPPTVILEFNNAPFIGQPVFSFTGTGDLPSIVNGQLGIHNATQNSEIDILISVDNGYDANNYKQFWFEYDWYGAQPTPTAGTDDPNAAPATGILYGDATAGNHVEGLMVIIPQPDSEWLNLHFSVAAGETVAIDNLRVGSHCEVIPEPSTVVMFAIGGFLLPKCRRKIHSHFGTMR